MPNDDRQPGGLGFWNAVREFSDPELLAAHYQAQGAAKRPKVRSISFEEFGQVQRQDNADKRAVQQSLNAVLGDFWALVKKTGDVIAIGCRGSVDEPAREIPRGEWDWLPDRPGKDDATFTGNGRTWYRVLFHRRKSRGSQRPDAALVSVEMYSQANGPEGMLEPGHRYDLPKDVAELLIASGAARMTEDQPNMLELDAADPNYPGPWDQEEWWEGISLSDWAEWRDPEAWAQREANCGGYVVNLGASSYEDERESRLCSEAAGRLLEILKGDLKGGRIVLGFPGELPGGHTSPVPKDTLSRIVKEIGFRGYVPPGEVSWQKPNHEWVRFEVRVYLPDRFAEVAPDPKPAGSAKDRRGRKAAFDHAVARQEAVRFLAHADGLPRAQAELENHILDWLAEDGMHPSTSTVRGFVSKEFGYLWDRPNS